MFLLGPRAVLVLPASDLVRAAPTGHPAAAPVGLGVPGGSARPGRAGTAADGPAERR
ncbi:hypothetical protein ACH9EU_16395 [Kocuria sp. M1R5S2]|uniref:hypothetical protein n=1 Tax=Kocuria rhizosphaerae TaxID=3376285 RepID=UPI0037B057F8